jgi:hypothetical protein
MYAQPAGVIHVPPAVVPHAEVETEREVKRHRQRQEEDKEGKVGPRELHSEVPVDSDANEGQVRHKQRSEELLLHGHNNPDNHVLCGGAPCAGCQRLMWMHVLSATRQHRHVRA